MPNKTWAGEAHGKKRDLRHSSEGLKPATRQRRQHEKTSVHLLIVRRPDAAGDLTLQVDLRRPVSLPADGADQDETVPVGDERLGAVM